MTVMIAKGSSVTVRTASRGVNCPVVDSDTSNIWVRLPTNTVLKLAWNPRSRRFEGRSAGMDFAVDPDEN